MENTKHLKKSVSTGKNTFCRLFMSTNYGKSLQQGPNTLFPLKFILMAYN